MDQRTPQAGKVGCKRKTMAPFFKHPAVAGIAMLMLTLAMDEAGANEDRRDTGRGGANYATYCSPCHGANGSGNGPMAALLNPRPARHIDSAYMNTLSDDYMFRVIMAIPAR